MLDKVYGYHGITHDIDNEDLLTWEIKNCKHNIHCFDEVENSDGDWYLICDACGLIVNIKSIEAPV